MCAFQNNEDLQNQSKSNKKSVNYNTTNLSFQDQAKKIDLRYCIPMEQCSKSQCCLAIVASLGTVLQHEVVVLSLADSPSSVFGASSIRVLVLAWWRWRSCVVQIYGRWILMWVHWFRIDVRVYRILPHPYIFLRRMISASRSCSAVPSLLVGTLDIY